MAAFARLGTRSVYDLRTEAECEALPDRPPAGTEHVVVDVLGRWAYAAPALFHCTAGKDRTGWAAVALLTLLGVPDELMMKDYLLTNAERPPAEKPVLDRFRAPGGDPDVLRPQFGTIEGYFSDGLNIDADAQKALRAAFVEHY